MLGARGPRLEVVADATFLTEPVSCEVSNAVGSANRSTALEVLCEKGRDVGVTEVGVVVPEGGTRTGVGLGLAELQERSEAGVGAGLVALDFEWRMLPGDLHVDLQCFEEADPGSGTHPTPLLSLLQMDPFCRQNQSPCPWTWGKTPPSAVSGAGTHFHG